MKTTYIQAESLVNDHCAILYFNLRMCEGFTSKIGSCWGEDY